MTGKEISEALRAGRCVFGTSILADSPFWPEAVKSTGIDFVFIDTEHVPRNREQLAWVCLAYKGVGLAPIIRIPKSDPQLACMALDGGAVGIMVPYVETAEQVQQMRGAVKLRPLKGQRLQDVLAGKSSLSPEVTQYLAKWNDGNLLVINIESVPGVENLDAILDVPGLDAILVGPHDLSINLGIPEQYDHPLFLKTTQTIIDKARAKNVGVGIHFWIDPQPQVRWIEAGANFIFYSSDHYAMMQSIKGDIGTLRCAAKQELSATKECELVI